MTLKYQDFFPNKFHKILEHDSGYIQVMNNQSKEKG
jgi:hypothetical protein